MPPGHAQHFWLSLGRAPSWWKGLHGMCAQLPQFTSETAKYFQACTKQPANPPVWASRRIEVRLPFRLGLGTTALPCLPFAAQQPAVTEGQNQHPLGAATQDPRQGEDWVCIDIRKLALVIGSAPGRAADLPGTTRLRGGHMQLQVAMGDWGLFRRQAPCSAAAPAVCLPAAVALSTDAATCSPWLVCS
jgi:hypothetical protein